MKTTTQALAAVIAATLAAGAHAADSHDADMLKLATTSGCMTCHHIDPGGRGPDGLPPIGPAWRDVSVKYAKQAGAEDQLVRTVMAGSNPYESHWKGKVSGLAMPPNKVAITEADARRLVQWILQLEQKH